MDKDTGGPAFPTPTHNLQNDGMTLRDYFAAKALMGMMASRGTLVRFAPEEHASYVYAVADAMLKARRQE